MIGWLVRYEVTLTFGGESKSFRFTNMKDVRWALYMATAVTEFAKVSARDRWTGRALTP